MTLPVQNGELRQIFKREAKTERISFRLSSGQKASIRKAARSVGVPMSKYVLRLHDFAVQKASE